MILINLLPEESRQKRRTPIKLMMAVTASVAVNGSLIAWWAWTGFGVAAEVKSELALLQDTKAGLDPQIAYHRDLEKESKLFDAREETLKKVTVNRISWTRKLDELIDVVNVGGDGEKYLVWFDDLTVDQKENARAKSYGKLKASGHSGSTNPSHVANFMDDIEASPFCEDFKQPAPPEGSTSSRDEGLMPNEVWNFPLEVDLKAPDERKKVEPPAAEPGKGPGKGPGKDPGKDPGKKAPADKAASTPDAKGAATAGSEEKRK